MRDELLATLDHEQPLHRKTLLHRAHAHFVARALQTEGPAQAACRDEAMACVEQLFYILLDLQHPGELAEVLDRTRWLPNLTRPQAQRLDYYEAVMLGESYRYEQSVKAFKALLSQRDLADELRARALNSSAIFFRRQGQHDRAIDCLQASREIWRRLHDPLGEAKTLHNLGGVLYELAEYDAARAALEASIDIFRSLGQPGREDLSIENLGLVYRDLGQWADAINCFERCLARRLPQAEREAMYAYNHLGEIYHFLGQWAEAETMYRRALDILRRARDAGDLLINDAPINLAFLFHTRGEFDQAQQYYAEALQFARDTRNDDRRSLIHYRLGDLAERQDDLATADGAYRQAIETLEAMRGRIESESVKISLLGARQQAYHAMVLLCLRQGDVAEAFHFAERARSRAFLDILAARDPSLAAQTIEPVMSLAEVQAALPADACIVEYFTTGVVERGDNIINHLPPHNAGLRDYLLPPSRTLAFVVTSDDVQVRELPISPNSLRPSEADALPGPRFLQPAIRRRLCQALIEPLADLMDGRQSVTLIPHGTLHYVPFLALTDADGEPFLRADGPEIAFAPSATVLFRHCQPVRDPAPEPCLALGYNGPTGTPRPPLAHAEAEAESVVHITGGQALTGPVSKKDTLFQTVGQWRWLHLSCHGRFNPANPLASDLQLAEDESLTALDILTHLRLRTELVTLSACSSGVSRVMRGDELIGLARAFITAGTPALVCTLWQVEEVSTRILLEHFYRDLVAEEKRANKAAALKRAQLYLRELSAAEIREILARWGYSGPEPVGKDVPDSAKIFSDPYFWAPFILIGNPL